MAESIVNSLETAVVLDAKQRFLMKVLERLLRLFTKEQNGFGDETSWEQYLFSLGKVDRSVINVAKFDKQITVSPQFIAKKIIEWIFENQELYTQEHQNPAVYLQDTQFENPRINTDFIYVAIKNSEDIYTVLKGKKNDDDQVEFQEFNNVTLQQLQELGKVAIIINNPQKNIQPGNCWDHNQISSATWLSVDIDSNKIVFNSDHLVLDGYGIISMLASLSQAVIIESEKANPQTSVEDNDVENSKKSEPLLPFEIEDDEKINLSKLRTAFLQTLREEGVEGTVLIPILTNPKKPQSRIAIALIDTRNAQDYIKEDCKRDSMLLRQDSDNQVLSKIFALLYNSEVPQKLQRSLQYLVQNYPQLTLQLYNLLAGVALFSAPRVSVDSVRGYKIYANTVKNRTADSINLTLTSLKAGPRSVNTLCLSGAGRFTNSEKLKSFKEKLLQKYKEL